MYKFIFFVFFLGIFGMKAIAKENYPTVSEKSLKGIARTSYDSPNPSKEQLERRSKSNERISKMGLHILETLPVTEDPSKINSRTASDISKRAIAVAIAAVKGEGLAHDKVIQIVNQWDISSYFSPEEKIFINNPKVSREDRLKFSWRYEGLDVLLWALGYKDELPPPNQICDVKTDVSIIVNNQNGSLAKNSKLRSMNEIMDMADYYYRLHWVAVELRISGKKSSLIDGEIIMERHYALNWLIKYMGQKWDDIQTDT